MLPLKTEQSPTRQAPLDSLPLAEAASTLLRAQREAAEATLASGELLARAATALAATISGGGILYYAAAGSSALMAAADAMELGGTFGIPSSQVRILMAGGIPQSAHMPGDVEDATDTLDAGLASLAARDCVIAVSASGRTPFAVEAARRARASGATVVAIANNQDAELFSYADHSLLLDTPAELVAGSTRLGAGTAQKIALNTLSTLMGVALGHVYQGRMVNLVADNDKLRARARGIVQHIANTDPDTAAAVLEASAGNVKLACILAQGASSADVARTALEAENGHLSRALARLELEKS
ncbi:MAG: N-acetylmuramic acid 6-phosphate etherase [Pseudomonadota bacterium]